MQNQPAYPSAPDELDRLPHAGDVIAGKYEIERVIGAGGMGVVVAARHLMLNQQVAVKFLHPHTAIRSDPVQRFLREARAAASLRSEHVARVLDVGTLPSGDPYMVMEYLDGAPLSRVIRKRAPLPVDEAVHYLLQACDAIGEAHRLGIIHRDLKPGNMFITQRPNGTTVLKVLDFGISKHLDPETEGLEQALTATNMVMGSPQYASPEQLKSAKHVDARTDIWSLGVVLYYMLTGKRPFDAETLSGLLFAIGQETPAPITALRRELPTALQDVVMRCLEKNREQRMPDVPTLMAALRPFAPAAAVIAPPSVSGPFAPLSSDSVHQGSMPTPMSLPTEPPITRNAWTATPQSRRANHVLAIQLVTVVALCLAVGSIFLILRRGGSSAETSQVQAVAAPKPAPLLASARAAPAGEAAVTDPIIDSSNWAAPPAKPAAPSKPSAQPAAAPAAPKAWGVANKQILLTDEYGTGKVMGKVKKGGRLAVIASKPDGRTFVAYSENGAVQMGWAPTSAITLDP